MELIAEIEALFSKYQKKPDNKTWLRSTDVRKMLKISHGTLQNLRTKGIIKGHKMEGMLFYDADEIDRVLLENEVSNGLKYP